MFPVASRSWRTCPPLCAQFFGKSRPRSGHSKVVGKKCSDEQKASLKNLTANKAGRTVGLADRVICKGHLAPQYFPFFGKPNSKGENFSKWRKATYSIMEIQCFKRSVDAEIDKNNYWTLFLVDKLVREDGLDKLDLHVVPVHLWFSHKLNLWTYCNLFWFIKKWDM